MGSERRRDYMVSKRVHFFYMLTWINSLLLVAAFAALVWTLIDTEPNVRQVPNLMGWVNPFLLMGVLAFVIVCTSLVLGVYTIIHTHHLLGSAYRIGVVLREMNEGKGTRIKLREGDFFTEISDEINRLADERTPATAAASAASDAPAQANTEQASGEASGQGQGDN